MKAYSFDNWEINKNTIPLLFFVQCMEEMLFPYGHNSYRVPTLNFHFLCVEILNSIEKIESDIIDKGNMTPLFEELHSMFYMDCIATKLYGTDFYGLFYNKNEKGEYARDVSGLKKEPGSEVSIKIIQKTISFLIDDMEINDKYLETLKKEIEKYLLKETFDMSDAGMLYSMSKLLLTELVNRGYSQEYIFSQIKERYYSTDTIINNVSEEINYFWDIFSFIHKKYQVLLPIKRSDIQRLLMHFQNVEVLENEDKLFGNSCHWIAGMEIEALDPENARSEVTSLLNFFVSLKQYNSHMSKSLFVNQAKVIDLEDNKEYNLSNPVALLSRGRTRSEEQIYIRIGEMLQNLPIIGGKMINVINLHSSAMDSKNESNQLLNLWTIIEVLIEVDKRYSYSKIVQISNTLTTIQNASYVQSLIEQMFLDLKHCCDNLEKYMNVIEKGNDEIEKLVSLLVLPEYANDKARLLDELVNYPLLKYRINHYSQKFADRTKLKNMFAEHRKRLEWQIMRIYRNRNMIVHDGSHFPYIDLVVQNLHFYVDTLIDTINYYIGKGYDSLDVIYTLLSHNELFHQQILEKKDSEKRILPIGEDYIEVILGKSYMR